MHAALERGLAHEVIQLLEHAGRLVVHDGAVIALGLIEVGQVLPHGRCSRGGIHVVGCRLVAQVERHPRAAVARGGLHLGGHVRGESFLEPQVVEPAHRREVAEPLMRDLVIDGGLASKPLVERRRFAVDERLFVVEDRARVFHAAERECRSEQEVELVERIGDAEVVLQPGAGAPVERHERVGFHFARPRGAHPEVDVSAVAQLRIWTGREGEEVRRDGFGRREHELRCGAGRHFRERRAVGKRPPSRRNGEGEREYGLEVRLVEAWEQQVGVRWDQQRVEVVALVRVIGEANDAGASRGDG